MFAFSPMSPLCLCALATKSTELNVDVQMESTQQAQGHQDRTFPTLLIGVKKKKKKKRWYWAFIEIKPWMSLTFTLWSTGNQRGVKKAAKNKINVPRPVFTLKQQHIHHPADLPPRLMIALIKYSQQKVLISCVRVIFVPFHNVISLLEFHVKICI